MRLEEIRVGMLIKTYTDKPIYMTRAGVEVVGHDYVVVRDCGLCPGDGEAYLIRKADLEGFMEIAEKDI